MKNKVLLYNGVGGGYADSDNSPSLSLMALSAYLKSRGYDVALLLNSHSDAELASLLDGCLAVGLSVFSGNGIIHSLERSAAVRSIAPGIPLVWGGYHPSLEPDQTMANNLVDYVVRGDGELPFSELLECLRADDMTQLGKVAGLSYRDCGSVIHNAHAPVTSIDSLPLFDYSLYSHLYRDGGVFHYVASRGCPFDCKFCCTSAYNKMFGNGCRRLPMDRMAEDLDTIVSTYSPSAIEFWDDTFLVGTERLQSFIHVYDEHGFDFKWRAFGRCDLFSRMDAKLVDQLKSINLERIFFGVESGSQRILDMQQKRMTIDHVLDAARLVEKHGLASDYTFVNGFPHETEADVRSSIRLRRAIKRISSSATIRFFSYTPLPQTATMNECVSLGYEKPGDLEEWALHEYHTFKATWLSDSHNRLSNSIAWSSFFDNFCYRGNRMWLRLVYSLLKADCRARLRYGCFALAPELMIINRMYRKKLVSR